MPEQLPPIPRRIAALIGTGDPACPRCHGDGVVVRFAWPKLWGRRRGDGMAFVRCECIAKRNSKPLNGLPEWDNTDLSRCQFLGISRTTPVGECLARKEKA